MPGLKPIPQSLQQATEEGTPDWASSGPIPTVLGSGGSQARGEIADVAPGVARINVARPDLYTKPIAGHEATHVFQGTRNGDFQRSTSGLLHNGGNGPVVPEDYDYGGIARLTAHPQPVSRYNPEQTAMMVEDLTRAQDALPVHPTRGQLAAWDRTKTALERPIRQLTQIPAADNSLGGRIDEYFNARPELGIHSPIARIKGLVSPAQMSLAPPPNPMEAPSAALGYFNRSKLVK